MEEKLNDVKKKKIWPLIIAILVIVLLSGGGYYYYTNYYNKESVVNNKPSLKDDFYENINYDTIQKAIIPSDSGSWSRIYKASKVIENRQEEITDEILSDPNYKNEDFDTMIELYTDYENRNKRGFSELKPYITLIDNASNINEFNDVLMKLVRDLDVEVLTNLQIEADLYDANKKVLYIAPVTITDSALELFTDAKFKPFVPIFEKLIIKYYESIGYTEEKAKESLKELEEFAKVIQAKSITQSSITDIFDIYNKYTLDEISKDIKNVPLVRLIKELKIDKEDFYVIYDMGHYKALEEYYTEANLKVLKELAKLQLVNGYFAYTTRDNEKFIVDITNELNGTAMTIEDYDKQMMLTIKSLFIMDELQKRYEEKYFTSEDKKIVSDLTEEIRSYYRDVIQNSEWLTPQTKEEAIKKLDSIKIKIGYQGKDKEKKEEYKPVPKSKGGTLISNVIGSNRFEFDRMYKEFAKSADQDNVNTLDVNAYYSPTNNSIYFLAGFKEIYGNETDYYRLMGYFGFVIGHEMSHAFDDTGSKFDENGKVKDWWTEEDKTNYEKLTKKIEDYYANYEYMGFKVDGKKTLGENIADLASMKAMISIAESKGATNDDFKKMFEAYAELWVEKTNEETIRQLSLIDTHAFNKTRVNAVLSSMDKFYEVYDIKEGDKMFVPKDRRVGLW